MSKSGKCVIGGIIGGFIGAQATGVLIGALARANPDIGTGKAFGLEGAETMIALPIVLGLVLVGAIVGAVLGALVASRWH